MSKVIDILDVAAFEAYINSGRLVVIDFAAEGWCVPCRQFRPHFEKAAETNEDTYFLHVDIEKADPAFVGPDGLFHVQAVPTVMSFKDGKRLDDIKSRTIVALQKELVASEPASE